MGSNSVARRSSPSLQKCKVKTQVLSKTHIREGKSQQSDVHGMQDVRHVASPCRALKALIRKSWLAIAWRGTAGPLRRAARQRPLRLGQFRGTLNIPIATNYAPLWSIDVLRAVIGVAFLSLNCVCEAEEAQLQSRGASATSSRLAYTTLPLWVHAALLPAFALGLLMLAQLHRITSKYCYW